MRCFLFFFAEKTVIIAIENAIIVKKNRIVCKAKTNIIIVKKNEIVENVTVENVIVWEKKIKM